MSERLFLWDFDFSFSGSMHLAWRFLLNLLDGVWLASVLLTAFTQFLHHSSYLGAGASFFFFFPSSFISTDRRRCAFFGLEKKKKKKRKSCLILFFRRRGFGFDFLFV